MKVVVIYGSEGPARPRRGIRSIANGWKESKGIEVSTYNGGRRRRAHRFIIISGAI